MPREVIEALGTDDDSVVSDRFRIPIWCIARARRRLNIPTSLNAELRAARAAMAAYVRDGHSISETAWHFRASRTTVRKALAEANAIDCKTRITQ